MSAPGEVPVGFRFKADGIDDTIDRIKQLHSELNNGQITTREYRTGIREVTTETRAATQEFNQIKGAIYAANPTLLEFTKTMSGFSAVAQTGLSITNAINLALLATQGTSNQLQDLKTKLADARLEYERFANSPQFGPASPQAQAALSKIQELTNQYNNTLQQWYIQQITNDITLASSVILTINQITQLSTTMRTLAAAMDPVLAENFAVALSGVGGVLLTWLGPVALVVAGIEAIYQLVKLLDPAFAETANNLENSIMENWHVDSIEATLLAPFVGFAGGVVQAAYEIYSVLVNLYNSIVTNVLNPLINSWDSTLGSILGKIHELGTVTYSVPSANQILQGFGLGSNSLGGSSGTNANADSINKMLIGSPTTSTAALNSLQQSAMYTGTIASGQTTSNQYLNSILTNGLAGNQLAQQQLNAINQQKQAQTDVKTALQAGVLTSQDNLKSLQDQLAQAQAKLSSASSAHANDLANSPNLTASDFPDIMSAIGDVNTLQGKIAAEQQNIQNIQSKSQSLDNATSGLAPVLSSIGLSADTGIGSIISGALGDYGGVGGAGISADQLAEFVQTHDYGVFTKATIGDSFPNGSTGGHGNGPTDQQQIDDLAASLAKNLGIDLSSHPYLIDEAKNTLIKGHVIKAATGFDGMVNSPTHFLAGESGPEFVNISPSGKGGKSTSVNVTVNVGGSVLSDYDLKNTLQSLLKDVLKASGFT